MNSWVFSSTSASLENDMDNSHVSYISRTMFLSLEKGLVALFPCITRKLRTHSCGILLTSMWYTKQLLFSLYPYSTLVENGGSSDPPLSLLLLDLSYDIDSLLFVGMPVKPFPKFENCVTSEGISGVVAVNSQRDVYVAYQS
jgi:hypothetical protein